jgi:transcriptional regulator with XRE-family HTH domain
VEGRDVGGRVSQSRRAKGLTQIQLAQRLDHSESWVRGLEKGRQPLVKRKTIERLAEVLSVDVAWLLGQPYTPPSPDHDAGHGSVPELRGAIRRTSLILSGHPGIPVVTPSPVLTEVRRQVTHVTRLRQAADLPGVMRQLPELLENINTSLLDTAGDLDEAHRLLIETSHVARMILNQLGHHDLAWSAVENGALGAARLGDALFQACSAWDRCGVLLHTGATAEAISVAEAALGHLEPRLAAPTPQELSLWGALQLRCAVAASRRHDAPAAWQYLSEAEAVAQRLGVDRNDFQTVFGPTNVEIHAVEIAVELDQPDTALRRSQHLDLSPLRSRERVVHHGITLARAYGETGQDVGAVQVLASAAAVSPTYVHNHPMARGLVAQLRQRSHPSAVEAGLGPLQHAMNLG